MKTLHKIFLLLSVIAVLACEETIEPMADQSDNLIGSWVNPVPVDTCWRYERAYGLNNNDYGFAFQSDQVFVERKNAGFCGTPPITYANFEGTWAKKDSIINISVEYWGGIADYQWKVISVNDQYLTIYKVKEEYHNR